MHKGSEVEGSWHSRKHEVGSTAETWTASSWSTNQARILCCEFLYEKLGL